MSRAASRPAPRRSERSNRGFQDGLRCAAWLIALPWIASGCGERPEATFEQALGALSACPTGDAPWRDVLDRPEATERAEHLRARFGELAEQCPARWEPHWALAEAWMREDRVQAATPHLERVRERARDADDPTGLALGLNGLGWSAFAAGAFERAESLYEAALAAASEAGRVDLASFVHNNRVALYTDAGDFVAARRELEAAEAGLAEVGMPEAALALAYNRAVVLLELGDAAAAGELLEACRERAGALDDAWTHDAATVMLGHLHLALEELEAAETWYARVTSEHRRLEARAALGRAIVALRRGRFDDATAGLRGLVERSDEFDRHFGVYVETVLAEARLASGDTRGAAELAAKLAAESDEIGTGDTRWAARWLTARAQLAEGDADGIASLRDAVAVLDAQSDPLDVFGEGLYFLRGRKEPWVDLAVALAERGRPSDTEEVWRLAARARARALGRVIRGAAPRTSVGDSEALRGRLAADEAVLSYLVGEERSLVVAVRRDGMRTAVVAGRRDFVDALRAYRDATSNAGKPLDGEALEAGRRVRRALIDPVRDVLDGATRIFVVPDGELALLPFAALPSTEPGGANRSGEFLGDVFEIAVLPVTGVPPDRPPSGVRVLLAGRPIFGPEDGFDELPWAAFELSGLRELWSDLEPRLVEGRDLSRDALERVMAEGWDLIHLATHAVASTRDPRKCGVVLSGAELLGIDAIGDMRFDDSLIVLSACRTGQGELVPGQGVIGLGWAFLRAGARGIVVSHWPADDAAAAKLMIEFHRRLRAGDDPVRALSGARRARRAEQAHPAHWALFDVVMRPG